MNKIIKYTIVAAFLVLATAALVIAPVAVQLSEAADDVLIIGKDAEAVISGTILEVGDERMVLLSNAQEVKVSLDKIDLDDASGLLAAGMNVTVTGKYGNGILDADKVMRISDGTL